METVSLYVLWLIAVGVISYVAGNWKYRDELATTKACMLGERHARYEWVRRYNDLYDLYLKIPHTYENCAEEMLFMFNWWASRKEIAEKFNVPYPTTCEWIRKKIKEKETKINPIQNPLI